MTSATRSCNWAMLARSMHSPSWSASEAAACASAASASPSRPCFIRTDAITMYASARSRGAAASSSAPFALSSRAVEIALLETDPRLDRQELRLLRAGRGAAERAGDGGAGRVVQAGLSLRPAGGDRRRDGLCRLAGLPPVLGDVLVAHGAGELAGHARVQHDPQRLRRGLVDALAHQVVNEAQVLQQAGGLQRIDRLGAFPGRQACDRGDPGDGARVAGDRRRREHAPRALGRGLDPAPDQFLDPRRDPQLGVVGGDLVEGARPAVLLRRELSAFEERAQGLQREEGIAAGAAVQPGGEELRSACRPG